jgi:Gpi18-like mannosyltransferase
MEDLSPPVPVQNPPAPAPARAWVRDSLLICLGLKLLFLFLGVVVSEVRLDKPFRTEHRIFAIWHQWDSRHYFDIAENGYKAPGEGTTLVLPPLLPLLIRAGAWVTGSWASGGVLVVTLISFLPGLLLYQLARCDLDEDSAFRAMLVLFLFPSSFFLHIVYTEGLFLTTVLAAFLAARRGNWRAVAIFGVLAGLTRINAVALAPALLFEAWGDSPKGRVPRVLASLTVGLGIAVYLWINYAVAGDPLAFLTVQKLSFYRSFAWPWQGALNVWNLAIEGGSNGMMNGVLQVICIPLLLAACAIAVIRQRPSYAIWTIGQVLIFTAQGFWLSLPRLALALFPAFIWLGPRTARPVFGTLWFAASTLFLSFLAGQFAQGWWVS